MAPYQHGKQLGGIRLNVAKPVQAIGLAGEVLDAAAGDPPVVRHEAASNGEGDAAGDSPFPANLRASPDGLWCCRSPPERWMIAARRRHVDCVRDVELAVDVVGSSTRPAPGPCSSLAPPTVTPRRGSPTLCARAVGTSRRRRSTPNEVPRPTRISIAPGCGHPSISTSRTLCESADAQRNMIFLDAERPAYPTYWADLQRTLKPGACSSSTT